MNLNRKLAKLKVDARMGTLQEKDLDRFARAINSICNPGCVHLSEGRFAVYASPHGPDSLYFRLTTNVGIVLRISDIRCITRYPTQP